MTNDTRPECASADTRGQYSRCARTALITLTLVLAVTSGLLFATLPCPVAACGLALPLVMVGIILRVSTQQRRRQARHDAIVSRLEGK